VKIEKMIAGAASYVDRILRDALPNCLFKPQPNLSWSCAKKLCAIRPATAPALLARADEVISRDAMSALDQADVAAFSGKVRFCGKTGYRTFAA
jgi:hypothetical protein